MKKGIFGILISVLAGLFTILKSSEKPNQQIIQPKKGFPSVDRKSVV